MPKQKKHANIPVFIPHLGCPNACVFCNQRAISGHGDFALSLVRREIDEALATLDDCPCREIAFFGGSFTGIDRVLMIELLETAQGYVDAGRVQSVRLSTRPDYIDDEVLRVLSHYAVRTVELGLQSMDDRVLTASRRGHDSETAARACRLVKSYGFDLVGQMMIGLPESDGESECRTARRIIELGADAARVYPTVVFRNTELCRMAQSGAYQLLSQEDTLTRTADVLEILDAAAVPVIRVGLCASENLSAPNTVYGGANESAIGELAMGEVFYRRMRARLRDAGLPKGQTEVIFRVPGGAISRAVGQQRKNTDRLCREFGLRRVRIIEDGKLYGYQTELFIHKLDGNA